MVLRDEEITLGAFAGYFSHRCLLQSIFLLLGIGALVPWNAFISAKPYFESRLCSQETSRTIPNIESIFSTVYNVSSVITMILVIGIQILREPRETTHQRIVELAESHVTPTATTTMMTDTASLSTEGGDLPNTEAVSFTRRVEVRSPHPDHSFWLVTVPLFVFLLVFALQCAMVLVVDVPHFWSGTLVSISACGVASGIAGAGFVAAAGAFPPTLAMNPYQLGMSAAGVAVSFVNFVVAVGKDPADYYDTYCPDRRHSQQYNIFAASDAVSQRWYTRRRRQLERSYENDILQKTCQRYTKVDGAIFLYFFLGMMVLLLCLIGYSYIHNLGDVKEEDDHSRDGILRPRRRLDAVSSYETIQMTTNNEDGLRIGAVDGDTNRSTIRTTQPSRIDSSTEVPISSSSSMSGPDGSVSTEMTGNDSGASFTLVWECVYGPALCIFVTFFITLGLFPGWTSEIQSIYQCGASRFANDLFVPLSFLLFNVGDFLGRWWAATPRAMAYFAQSDCSKKLLILSTLRIIYFPLLFVCHRNSSSSSSWLAPWEMHSDVYSIGVQFLLAVSNGFLIAAAFLHAPSLLHSNNEGAMAERMSEILSLAVSGGLFCGSLLSMGVARIE